MQATREAGPLLQAAASPELRSAVRSAPREHTGGLTRCDSHAGARRRLFASGYAAPPTRSYETEGGRYRLRQLVTKQLRTIKRPHSNEFERATPRIVLSLTISPQGSRVRYYTVRLFYT